MSLFLAILALGVLIIVHESGHYFVARWSGMRVERFSLGFGPPLLKWKRGDTHFQVAPIPLGGFVQITGMNPHEEYDEKDPSVYPNRPTYQRFLTILAGPGMNYVFSIVLIFVVFAFAGIETETAWYKVGGTEAGKPAAGKLQPGDRILAVNGQPIYAYLEGKQHTDFRAEIQKSHGAPVTLTVLRSGQQLDVEITPVRDTAKEGEEPAWLLGIGLVPDPERRDVGVGTAAYRAVVYPWEKSGEILVGLYKVIRREVPGEVTGPVGITAAIKNHIEGGWVHALQVLALLNVYLGLFNLLPLPALDGGRLVFLGYELATRRRPNPKVEAAVHMVGFLALLFLMVLVTFKDIKNALS